MAAGPLPLNGWLVSPAEVVLYLVNPSTAKVRDAIDAGVFGAMLSPAQHNKPQAGWKWALDNGAFGGRFRADHWVRAMVRFGDWREDCLFVAVPDALEDPVETARLWDVWRAVVVELGYPVAYVAQDGARAEALPWADLDVLFIGGSTAWKLGPPAWNLAHEAHRRGKAVHWGRVNSRKRFAMAALNGDSADGTFVAIAPNKNIDRAKAWLNTLDFDTNEEDTNGPAPSRQTQPPT